MTTDSPDFTKADLERGEALFRGPCTFVKGVVSVADLPKDGRAEVAFAGRSNVGKSSLINALTGRTRLARVSVTPGRTRELNFFALGQEKTPSISWTCRATAMPGLRRRKSKAGPA